MNELHLFAGAGGGVLGGMLLGHRTICAVEIEKYPRRVLLQRQRDGILPKFPIWDDVSTFDGNPWRNSVDILCGGFPCQDISSAGKGKGIAGSRSGLWKQYSRIIEEIRPSFVFAENSPLLRSRGLGVVLQDLASLGYDARWCILGSGDLEAPHSRKRMWVLASDSNRFGFQKISNEVGLCKQTKNAWSPRRLSKMGRSSFRSEPCPIGARPMGVGNVLAHELDRIKAAGNGQDPRVAGMAFRILSRGIKRK